MYASWSVNVGGKFNSTAEVEPSDMRPKSRFTWRLNVVIFHTALPIFLANQTLDFRFMRPK